MESGVAAVRKCKVIHMFKHRAVNTYAGLVLKVGTHSVLYRVQGEFSVSLSGRFTPQGKETEASLA